MDIIWQPVEHISATSPRTLLAWSCGLILLISYVYSKTVSKKPPRKRIPGPKVNAIITTLIPLINILRNNTASKGLLLFQVVCGYSHVFRKEGMWLFWGGVRPILMLFRPETVEPVLNSSEILEKGFEYDLLSAWLKEGLLASKGEKWKYRRKLLTPAFHFRILDEYIPVFNEQARVFASKLATAMSTQEWVDIAPLTSLCTLDIICETAMGRKINAQENSSLPYVQALHSTCKAATERLMQPWLWNDFIYKLTRNGRQFFKNLDIMDKFTRKVVAERKAEKLRELEQFPNDDHLKNDTSEVDELGIKRKKRLALLDLLLECHLKDPNFTLEDIAEEVDNFMFAGHDTTSSGLCWALYMLGLYPDVQRKVHEEIDDVVGDDPETPITLDHIKELKYLDCVLKETRRLLPPTPFIARELTQDTDINGYLIPKGTNCGILIYMLHRDPEVFPNPEAFDPDRFKLSNSTGRHPYAYVPFSAGPRNCIGQRFATFEAITVITTILRRFEVKSRDPLDKLHIVDELVLRSDTGLKMSFKERTHNKQDIRICDGITAQNGFPSG